jgi:hypothetical protein
MIAFLLQHTIAPFMFKLAKSLVMQNRKLLLLCRAVPTGIKKQCNETLLVPLRYHRNNGILLPEDEQFDSE